MSNISDRVKELRLKEADLVENTANRVPICIVVDTSYSMSIMKRIDHVNRGLKKFIKDSAEDDYAADALDIAIVAFNSGKPTVIQPFENVKSIKLDELRASGITVLGGAVDLAIKSIKDRVSLYESAGITTFKPWLIIMSDGEGDPTDKKNLNEAVLKVNRLLDAHRIKVMCVDMNGRNKNNDLRKFSADGKLESIDALQIEDFFSMLSRSAANLSTSTPEDDDDIGRLTLGRSK